MRGWQAIAVAVLMTAPAGAAKFSQRYEGPTGPADTYEVVQPAG